MELKYSTDIVVGNYTVNFVFVSIIGISKRRTTKLKSLERKKRGDYYLKSIYNLEKEVE